MSGNYQVWPRSYFSRPWHDPDSNPALDILREKRSQQKKSYPDHFWIYHMEHICWSEVDYRGEMIRHSILRACVSGNVLEVQRGLGRSVNLNGKVVRDAWHSDMGDFHLMQWLKREVLSGRLGKHDPVAAIRRD